MGTILETTAIKRGQSKVRKKRLPSGIDLPVLWSILACAPAYFAVWIVRAEIAWFPIYIWLLCAITTLAIGLIAWSLRRPNQVVPPQHDGLTEIASNNNPEGKHFSKIVVLSAIVPWAIQFIYRCLQYANTWNYAGEPYEILVLASLQNMTLAMALTATSPINRRLTISMSFFLMLFSIVISSKAWVYPVAAIYGVAAVWWLMGDYWEHLQDRFVGQSKSSSLPIRSGVLVGATLFLCSIASLVFIVSPQAIGLTGWLPTSGGTSWADPTSRNGVGDGDMLVAARSQAFSFGPVESDLFIEDKQPSLYDMISEMDGLPPKKKKAESAVGIEGSLGKTNHEKLANSKSSSREFSAVRQAPKVDRKTLKDKDSPSLIYYTGPVPQRLAIETFEKFDGINWVSDDFSNQSDSEVLVDPSQIDLPEGPVTKLVQRFGKPWIQFRQPRQAVQTVSNRSAVADPLQTSWAGAIKIIRFVSPRIPTPDDLDALHIDRIDRPEFFDRTPDGIATMVDREQVPSLTTIRIIAAQRNLHSLRDSKQFPLVASRTNALQGQSSSSKAEDGSQGRIDEIVQTWVKGLEPGWGQIEAITTKLQEEFVLDSQAVVPEDATNAVEHFLKTKRGPAYLFATTAAMMIRSLGYPSRLANGFYLASDTLDAASGQHLIGKKQLHWWPQVFVDGARWISIEPTPGYYPPTEKWTYYQLGQWFWKISIRWIRNHPLEIIAVALLAAMLYRLRVQCFDFVYTTIANAMGFRSLEERVSWSLWLLDRRAELAGCPRPFSRTQRQWFRSLPIWFKTNIASNKEMALSSIDEVLTAQDERLYSTNHRVSGLQRNRSARSDRLSQCIQNTKTLWTVRRLRDANTALHNSKGNRSAASF